jgi:GTP-binding protein
MDGTDPLVNFRSIQQELVEYNEQLGQRPMIVVVTKAELPGSEELQQQLQAELEQNVMLISAVTGQGLNELTNHIADTIKESQASQEG